MQFYQCKCGKRRCWGSDSPNVCSKCNDCGSNLAWSPNSHQDPVPHEFIPQQGGGDKVCKYCYRTKKEIKQLNN